MLNTVRVDNDSEFKTVMNLIISTPVCNEFLGIIEPHFFVNKANRVIFKWIKDYYNQEDEAPFLHIQDIYDNQANKLNDDIKEYIGHVLESLNERFVSMEYEINHRWLVRQTRKFLKTRSCELYIENLKNALDKSDLKKAEQLHNDFRFLVSGNSRQMLDKAEVCSTDFNKENIIKPPTFIYPWLAQDTLAMIYGWRGCGKTWLSLIIAYGLTRQNAHEHEIGLWDVRRNAGVLYLDGEMGEYRLQYRTKILESSMGPEHPDYPLKIIQKSRYVRVNEKPAKMSLLSRTFRDDIYKKIQEDPRYNVLILDNASSLASGYEENKKIEWDPVNEWLISLRHLGIAVIMIHHSGKDPFKQRGHSGREDALDVVINLSKPDNKSKGACFKVKFEKARDFGPGKRAKEFTLKVLEARPGHTGPICQLMAGIEKENRDALVKGLLLEGSLEGKQIAKLVGVSASTVSRIKTDIQAINLLGGNDRPTPKGERTLQAIRDDFEDLDKNQSLVEWIRERKVRQREQLKPSKSGSQKG